MDSLCYDYCDSPLGELLLLGEHDALCGLYLPAQKHRPSIDPRWRRDPKVFDGVKQELQAYFAGRLRRCSVPLRPQGTAFQRAVWQALTEIGFGETISYGALAARLGRPSASRAVGMANGRNPIAILIPCHRVVGSNGALTGYAGGLERKQWLLAHERAAGERASAERCTATADQAAA